MARSIADDVNAVAGIDAVPAILDVVCRVTGLRFAAVARVTDSSWTACAVRDEIEFGLKPGGELELATTICNEIRDSREVVVIDHATQDAAFCRHPTPKMYGFESYISVPIIRPGGEFFGTLCAIDPLPAKLSGSEVVEMFKLFAELISLHLDGQERLQRSEAALLDERETAQLREQFIAVLGHDLRNPLASISSGLRMLLKTPLDAKARSLVGAMQNSCARMAGLVTNVLDFARGRLGGGLTIERRTDDQLGSVLQQITEELRAVWPDRQIEASFELSALVSYDPDRMGQLFSNLLANALIHGASDAPVRVTASSSSNGFELSVANSGEPIPVEAIPRLFRPFTRSTDGAPKPGLGLGLYITSEIARAHGGTLAVSSTTAETRFTFRLPASATHAAPASDPRAP